MIGARLLADGTGVLLRLLGVRLHLHGLPHLPAEGPFIVASNHVSYVDFAAIQAARPRGRAPLWFLARWDLLPPWFAHPVMRRLGLVPVDERRRPGRAFPEALQVLEAGGAVGVHPEGRVRPSAVHGTGRSGAARLSAASGAPLVPCSVWGTQRVLTRGRHVPDLRRPIDVHVRLGPAVPVYGPATAVTRDLMRTVAALTARTLEEVGCDVDEDVGYGTRSAPRGRAA